MKITSVLAAFTISGALATASMAQETLSSATADVGSAPHFVMTSLASAAEGEGLANVQVQEGQALTRVQLAVARGELDMGTVPVVTLFLMKRGLAMYKDLGAEEGAKLTENLTAITGFNAGVYHVMTFADSGVNDWADIKGKRVFVGAPTGGAAAQVQSMIQIITGYKPGDDYEAIKLDWGADVQGMLDGKVDVVIRPGTIPAGYIDRLTSAGKVRLLGVPEDVFSSEGFTKFANAPGTLPAQIDQSVYDSESVEVLNGGNTLSIGLALTANANLDEDLVYNVTKAYIADLDGLRGAAPWVPSLNLDQGVWGLTPIAGIKLHPGALRAWEEAGVSIPDHLK
ncbi:TAXI family TRAP transporter solute-binding subunit [Sulfitobacter mediterraneus]|uniref:TAXI family TRAP transporter solute-binding subunit n=1 Tax=Sulfitobacter mediterraneus TaxID=83219 RepID=UPI0021A41F12|nr:TAXI family TRAP transporter solute-binding subunit [Sulfitobacter mediterraneus]UWR13394.1 TAXI family TRAP transporter solute-binding subunit [Sulfitobacter mediterraneus]